MNVRFPRLLLSKLQAAWGWIREQQAIQKWVTTIVLLAVIYYGTTTLVAWITAPRLEMTMSPIAGPVAVVAAPVERGSIARKVTYTGSCVPFYEATVYPRVEGWIEKIFVDVSDRVKKGQLIVRLDKSKLRAQLAEKEANLVYLEREFARDKQLLAGGAVSQSAYDLSQARYEMAKAEVENVKINIGYTDIYSEIDGVVTDRIKLINPGELVHPNTALLKVADLRKIRVQCRVAERDIPFLKVGTDAVVRFPMLSDHISRNEGKVSVVFPQLDPATRTATVEVEINNPNEIIKPDMYAVMDLILERRDNVLLIPRQALLENTTEPPKVFVTDAVMAMAREVKPGIMDGNRVEVLDGLKEGEMVVYKGNRGLTDMQQVSLVSGF